MPRRLALAVAVVSAALALAACTSGGTTAEPAPPPAETLVSPAASTACPIPCSPPLTAVHNPDQVTGSLAGQHCTLNGTPPDVLPNPACTPGGYDPAITAATIATTLCVPKPGGHGSTAYVQSAAWIAARPPSSQTTKAELTQIDPAYGLPLNTPGEVNHLVNRALGGSNNLSNLWLEPGKIPNKKDAVEDRLHDWMCAAPTAAARFGRLRSAQQAIAADWLTAEQVLGVS